MYFYISAGSSLSCYLCFAVLKYITHLICFERLIISINHSQSTSEVSHKVWYTYREIHEWLLANITQIESLSVQG